MSSTQITIILNTFKDFFDRNFVLDANHHYPGNFQRLFLLQIGLAANHLFPEIIQKFSRLQNCLRRKSSLSRNYSKIFSPAKMCKPQIINILKIFRDFFACKFVLTANHFYPENFQKLFGLQNCRSRKSSLSREYSKTFSPAKLSSTQITIILNTFKDFFDRNFVLDANHHYPGNFQRLFLLQIGLAANHLFPEIIQKFSRLQNCLRRKSSLSRNYSKIFSPAKMCKPQIINILKIFNDFLACKDVLAANHHYPENFQRLFRLQFLP